MKVAGDLDLEPTDAKEDYEVGGEVETIESIWTQ